MPPPDSRVKLAANKTQELIEKANEDRAEGSGRKGQIAESSFLPSKGRWPAEPKVASAEAGLTPTVRE